MPKLSALGIADPPAAPDFFLIVQGGIVKRITRNDLLNEIVLTLSDVTTNNASATKHGFVKKLPNDPVVFWNGVGNWSRP